jgi:carboxyl-terminal processing protease
MIKKNFTNFLLIFSLAIFLFGSGYRLGEYKEREKFSRRLNLTPSKTIETNNQPNIDFSLFWSVWDELEKKYIDKKKVEPKTMVYGAIKGMVASLNDPYTFFLTPDENQKSKNDLQGKFEGIGAQLGLKDNRIVVIAPLKNSPAEKAGLLAGDFINKVNGESTVSMSLNEAVSKIRGEKGTKVRLVIERNQKEKEIEIVRDQIDVPSVELNFEKENIAYIKVNQFGDNTYEEWDKTVSEIVSKKAKGLILDLRDNPGGYLEGSVYVASEFLSKGTLIVRQESTTYFNKDYRSTREGRLQNIPLVIIINKGSASASEILAGALRDHGRGKLIGEKSFGKGSVQEALDLKEGAGLHLTVAKWILPNGDWINGKGLQPEIQISNQTKEGNTLTKEEDNQLEKAIELLLK